MNTQDFKRKLTAVFSADVAGYSRLMGEDEAATVKTLEAYRQIMFSLIKQHRGRVIDSPGDNLLAEFASVVDAVQCGVDVQNELKARNADLPENRRMQFRIGINLGDVIEEQDRIYGDGVNIAARLESCAEPGGICVSKTAFDHIETKLPLGYEYLGEKEVKNIAKPVGAYRVLMEPRVTIAGAKEKKPSIPVWRRKGLLAGAAAVLVVIIGLAFWNFYWRAPKIEPASKEKMAFPLPDKPSIAVMPFLNMTADSKQDFFADGLSEGIITALAKVPQLFVIGRDSTFSYKGKAVKAKQMSEELGVQYILEGSVQKAGDKARITAQLIDALKGHHIWAERYDRELKDVFAVQDEVTKKIITALDVKLTRGEWGHIASKGTENLDAYLKSQEAASCADQSTRESLERGRRLSEEAISLDTKFPHPYHVLGVLQMIEALSGFSKNPRESLELANKMQLKAIELDESFSVARAVMSFNLLMLRKYDEAIEEAERAYRQTPGSSSVLYWYGTVLSNYGRPQEAVRILKEVLRLEPMPMNSRLRSLSAALRDSGQYNEAIECINKAIQREPNSMASQLILTSIYAYAGREEEARAGAKEILRINPKFSIEQYMRASPQRDANARERFAQALKIAGLPEKPPLPLPDKPSIAVLPFVNMSDDKSQEYFCDGITEEIIGALSKVGNLFVVSRNSSFTYKGKSVDVKQIGREMGVRYALEGSVRKEENRLRITAQLIDTTTGDHVFSERYDREMKDVFAVQDDITMKITTAMRVNLTHGEQDRMLAKGTKNLEAYLKILESRKYRETFNRESMAKSRQAAEEAIALDPGYAIAYSSAAGAIGNETWLGVYDNPAASLSRALELAQKGVALDDSLAYPRIALGFIYLMRKDYDKAIAEAERAVALEPSSTDALTQLGVNLFCGGRAEEAIPILQKAVSLSPVPEYRLIQNLANAYRSAGNYEKAIEINQKILQKQPNQMFPHLQLAATFMLMGKEEEARLHAAEVLRIDPKFSLERYSKTLPWKNREEVDRVIDAARKAGLK